MTTESNIGLSKARMRAAKRESDATTAQVDALRAQVKALAGRQAQAEASKAPMEHRLAQLKAELDEARDEEATHMAALRTSESDILTLQQDVSSLSVAALDAEEAERRVKTELASKTRELALARQRVESLARQREATQRRDGANEQT